MVVVVMAVNLEAASTKNLASKGKVRLDSLDSKLALSSNLLSETTTKGKYSPDQDKWAYKPDNRGKYVHVHIPYDGKYYFIF